MSIISSRENFYAVQPAAGGPDKQATFQQIREVISGGISKTHIFTEENLALKKTAFKAAKQEKNPQDRIRTLIELLALSEPLTTPTPETSPPYSSLLTDAKIYYMRAKTALDESTCSQVGENNSVKIEIKPEIENEYTESKKRALELLNKAAQSVPVNEKKKNSFYRLKGKLESLPEYSEIVNKISEKCEQLLKFDPKLDNKKLYFLCSKIERQIHYWQKEQISGYIDSEYHKYQDKKVSTKRKKEFPYCVRLNKGDVILHTKRLFEIGGFKEIFVDYFYRNLQPLIAAENRLDSVTDKRCAEKEEKILTALSGKVGPEFYGHLAYKDPHTRGSKSCILMKKYPIDLFYWGLAEKTLRSYASLNGHTTLLSFAQANCHDAPTKVALHPEEDYGVSFYKDPATQEIKFSIFSKRRPIECPIRDQSINLFANVDNALVNNQTTKKVCMNIIRQIKALHEEKYVHLDIKPDNFLLEGEQVIVIDFGFSRVINSVYSPTAAEGAYQPPEILLRGLKGFLPDVRSDIWSLGLLLFFMKYKNEFSFMNELHELCKSLADNKLSTLAFSAKAQVIFDSIAANGLFKPEQISNTNSLEYIISSMVKVKPEERMPLDKVLELLELLPDAAYSPSVNCGKEG